MSACHQDKVINQIFYIFIGTMPLKPSVCFIPCVLIPAISVIRAVEPMWLVAKYWRVKACILSSVNLLLSQRRKLRSREAEAPGAGCWSTAGVGMGLSLSFSCAPLPHPNPV